MAKISVIVPVFKVEAYLCRCIDSILGQTHQDLELILVDDGSPDNCPLICDGYEILDKRVHVIHQENGGLSAARNAALDWVYANSGSQWLTCIDSDDWVHPEFLERLLKAAQDQQVLVSICGYGETHGEEVAVPEESLTVEVWEPAEFYRTKSTNATTAWGKLYHRSCFENLRYPVGKIHEDEFITYQTLFMAEKIAFVPAPLYCYYSNYTSITKKGWTARRLDAWEAYEQQIEFFRQRGDEAMVRRRWREYLENAYAQLCAAQSAANADQLGKEIRFIKKKMRSMLRRAWKLGYVDFWIDYDMLYACDPIGAKAYRLWLEMKS